MSVRRRAFVKYPRPVVAGGSMTCTELWRVAAEFPYISVSHCKSQGELNILEIVNPRETAGSQNEGENKCTELYDTIGSIARSEREHKRIL